MDPVNVNKYPSVLTIAGSDSGGGAGIQADLKTFSALGCYGTTAITAVTVQNTLGTKAIHSIPVDIVVEQIRAVADDIRPIAIKIGMIPNTELLTGIAHTLNSYRDVPTVLDPVIMTTSGQRLVREDTIAGFQKHLFPMMTLITPNVDEAQMLLNRKINSVEDMQVASHLLLQMGCNSVLLKGGHLAGSKLYNVFVSNEGDEQIFESDFIQTPNLHGTGCTLSSAIACFLSLGYTITDAVAKAGEYVHQAILHGRDIKTGEGNGPLNHFFNPRRLQPVGDTNFPRPL